MAEEKATAEATAKTTEVKTPESTTPKPSFDNSRGGRKPFRGRKGGKGGRGRKREEKEFQEEVLSIDRVTRVVKGGRRLRFRATVIIGDKKGRVGVGIGKSTEVVGGIQKAIEKAKKSLIRVPLVKGTIPHMVKVKHKAAHIMLMPGKEGTGIIAGGAVRKICELAGIHNIGGKILGTNNKIVNAQATIMALQSLSTPIKKEKTEEKKSVEKPVEKSVEKPAKEEKK